MLPCKGDETVEDTHERIPLAHSGLHMIHKDVEEGILSVLLEIQHAKPMRHIII
jgi:hypothetical protein